MSSTIRSTRGCPTGAARARARGRNGRAVCAACGPPARRRWSRRRGWAGPRSAPTGRSAPASVARRSRATLPSTETTAGHRGDDPLSPTPVEPPRGDQLVASVVQLDVRAGPGPGLRRGGRRGTRGRSRSRDPVSGRRTTQIEHADEGGCQRGGDQLAGGPGGSRRPGPPSRRPPPTRRAASRRPPAGRQSTTTTSPRQASAERSAHSRAARSASEAAVERRSSWTAPP